VSTAFHTGPHTGICLRIGDRDAGMLGVGLLKRRVVKLKSRFFLERLGFLEALAREGSAGVGQGALHVKSRRGRYHAAECQT